VIHSSIIVRKCYTIKKQYRGMSMQEEKTSNLKKEILSYIKIIVITAVVVFGCKQFLFAPIKVQGASMYPTYHDKDIIIVSKTSKIERFDQIVFQSPVEDELYIKRVIGLPGDKVEMKDDVLYVNGKAYKEDYVNRQTDDPNQLRITENFTLEQLVNEKEVPKGMYFVLGDNRLKSSDSRHYGLISEDAVYGESKLILYPFSHFHIGSK
jgi:signal peptidase I